LRINYVRNGVQDFLVLIKKPDLQTGITSVPQAINTNPKAYWATALVCLDGDPILLVSQGPQCISETPDSTNVTLQSNQWPCQAP